MDGPQDYQQVFEEYRGLLFSVAYRMMGSVSEAEDIVQESWFRWRRSSREGIQSSKNYLVSIVTRLCIDELKSARRRREQYTGPWLPEPLVEEATEDALLRSESVQMAFLMVLQQLNPTERAAYLLREVFDCDYETVAAVVGTTPGNCRQLVSRAKRRFVSEPSKEPVNAEQERVIGELLFAASTGDLDALMKTLSDDVIFYSDGGGKVSAATKPLMGPRRVALFLAGIASKPTAKALRAELGIANGQPALFIYNGSQVDSVMIMDLRDNLIKCFYMVRNPEKLQHLQVADEEV